MDASPATGYKGSKTRFATPGSAGQRATGRLADPVATVDLVRQAGIHNVMGDCEESLGQNVKDRGCGFASGSACDLLSVAWYAHANQLLADYARPRMLRLPRRIDLIAGSRYANAMLIGLWPSTDVRPPSELARTGFPLGLGSGRWPAAATSLSRT